MTEKPTPEKKKSVRSKSVALQKAAEPEVGPPAAADQPENQDPGQ